MCGWVGRAGGAMGLASVGVEWGAVMVRTQHKTAEEVGMAVYVRDWKKGECDPIPGRTMPSISVVEGDYPNLYKKFTSLGTLLAKLGNGGTGMNWDTRDEDEFLGKLNQRESLEGDRKHRKSVESETRGTERGDHGEPRIIKKKN